MYINHYWLYFVCTNQHAVCDWLFSCVPINYLRTGRLAAYHLLCVLTALWSSSTRYQNSVNLPNASIAKNISNSQHMLGLAARSSRGYATINQSKPGRPQQARGSDNITYLHVSLPLHKFNTYSQWQWLCLHNLISSDLLTHSFEATQPCHCA